MTRESLTIEVGTGEYSEVSVNKLTQEQERWLCIEFKLSRLLLEGTMGLGVFILFYLTREARRDRVNYR